MTNGGRDLSCIQRLPGNTAVAQRWLLLWRSISATNHSSHWQLCPPKYGNHCLYADHLRNWATANIPVGNRQGIWSERGPLSRSQSLTYSDP